MKRLAQQLKEKKYDEIWKEYCGFLDLSLEDYMKIQKRLLMEQIDIFSNCELGRSILKGKKPKTIEEFRQMVPLTTYDDYADILLLKDESMLPDKPIVWIQTTWEGGKHPIKVAPYSRSMLDTFRDNTTASLILATSKRKGKFTCANNDRILYGLAPLPYATGLLPAILGESVDINFLPPVEEAVDMSFSQRNKAGFSMALKQGLEYFFGLGSVAYAVSLSLGAMGQGSSGGGIKSLLKCKPSMIYRILRAKYVCKKENRPLMPKDLFHLKGFMVAGTDNNCYKDDLERLWGIRPMEIFAGTEPTMIGTETWTRKGMYFFPDACFYEFIKEEDMMHNLKEPSYRPSTYLMDEVVPGEKYELAVTVLKGGAFVRYRVGDVYRCVGLENSEDETKIPRFEYVDRIPTIIDIGGFTRISESGIASVIRLSGLAIKDWTAAKEYNEDKRPYMHLYVEMDQNCLVSNAVTVEILREQLSSYFRYIDQDYRDLKKILGIDPLKVTILSCGTFERYRIYHSDKELPHMNPSAHQLIDLKNCQQEKLRRRFGEYGIV